MGRHVARVAEHPSGRRWGAGWGAGRTVAMDLAGRGRGVARPRGLCPAARRTRRSRTRRRTRDTAASFPDGDNIVGPRLRDNNEGNSGGSCRFSGRWQRGDGRGEAATLQQLEKTARRPQAGRTGVCFETAERLSRIQKKTRAVARWRVLALTEPTEVVAELEVIFGVGLFQVSTVTISRNLTPTFSLPKLPVPNSKPNWSFESYRGKSSNPSGVAHPQTLPRAWAC